MVDELVFIAMPGSGLSPGPQVPHLWSVTSLGFVSPSDLQGQESCFFPVLSLCGQSMKFHIQGFPQRQCDTLLWLGIMNSQEELLPVWNTELPPAIGSTRDVTDISDLIQAPGITQHLFLHISNLSSPALRTRYLPTESHSVPCSCIWDKRIPGKYSDVCKPPHCLISQKPGPAPSIVA